MHILLIQIVETYAAAILTQVMVLIVASVRGGFLDGPSCCPLDSFNSGVRESLEYDAIVFCRCLVVILSMLL